MRLTPFLFETDTFINKKLFVQVDKATNKATLGVDDSVDGVTLGETDNGVVAVGSIKSVEREYLITLGGTVAKGNGLMAKADGTAILDTTGTPVAYAKISGVIGDSIPIYNI